MSDVFQTIVDELDLREAVRIGSRRNDLLPPRHEDKVTGELGARFSEGLRTRLERGRYDPSPASLVMVRVSPRVEKIQLSKSGRDSAGRLVRL